MDFVKDWNINCSEKQNQKKLPCYKHSFKYCKLNHIINWVYGKIPRMDGSQENLYKMKIKNFHFHDIQFRQLSISVSKIYIKKKWAFNYCKSHLENLLFLKYKQCIA